MASSAISNGTASVAPLARPVFDESSDWSALQPGEQAQVILAAYQAWLLPELTRMEKQLTRVAVVFGLEYGQIEELAVFFLSVAREIRQHVTSLELAVARPAGNSSAGKSSAWEASVGNADMYDLILRLRSVTNRCRTDQETSPCYARLIAALRRCEQELIDLFELEERLLLQR